MAACPHPGFMGTPGAFSFTFHEEGHGLAARERKVAAAPPAIRARTPAINIHTDLSVGEPVKNRDTSEPNESIAITPMTIRTIPTMTKAVDTMLFILCFSFWLCPSPRNAALATPIGKHSNRSAK